MTKVPAKLQGVLWSRDIDKIDLDADSAYVINQVLALGSVGDIRWLFKTYGHQKIEQVFLRKPMKVYSPAAFNFVKEILLDTSDREVPAYRYDASLARHIG